MPAQSNAGFNITRSAQCCKISTTKISKILLGCFAQYVQVFDSMDLRLALGEACGDHSRESARKMAASTPRKSIADTFSRLLRLNLAGGPPLMSSAQLMAESEALLARAARHGSAREQQIAGQLLACPSEYQRWEAEHTRLMGTVASPVRNGPQVRALLSTAFTLVHRKALFEYMRSHELRGDARRLLVQHFNGHKSYTQAVVAEHGNFLRGSASLICVEKIGTTLLVHQAFGDPFRRYENLYSEYFRSYCDSYLAPPATDLGDTDSVRTLLPYLKRDVLDVRARLLAMPAVHEAGTQARR